MLVGRRLGYGSDPMPPHNLTYTAAGAALLWFGWFGFNAGSQLQADGIASSAFAATLLSAAAGLLAWASMEWFTRGKPSVLGACSGAVAGLVCDRGGLRLCQSAVGGCHRRSAGDRLLPGLHDAEKQVPLRRLARCLRRSRRRRHAGRGAHWPVCQPRCDRRGPRPAAGAAGRRPAAQGAARRHGRHWALAAVATFIILKALDATLGLRVSQQEEIQGLDVSQHGEEGYIFV